MIRDRGQLFQTYLEPRSDKASTFRDCRCYEPMWPNARNPSRHQRRMSEEQAEEQCRISTPHGIGYGRTGNSRANLGADEVERLLHFKHLLAPQMPTNLLSQALRPLRCHTIYPRTGDTEGVDRPPDYAERSSPWLLGAVESSR